MKENPKILMYGITKFNISTFYDGQPGTFSHNEILEVILSSGPLAGICFTLMLIILAIKSIKILFFSKNASAIFIVLTLGMIMISYMVGTGLQTILEVDSVFFAFSLGYINAYKVQK